MGVVSRVELPEEFYDRTSDKLLLAPDNYYLFAKLALGALGNDLEIPEELGLPGRTVSGSGADYVTPESQRLDLNEGAQLLQEAFAAKFNFDGEPGDMIRVNRPLYQDTDYAEDNRRVAANQSISTTPITIGSEQSDITLVRYAGPYDIANNRVAPYGIDAKDAKMGVHKLSKMVGFHMKRDYHKFIDYQYVLFGESSSQVAMPKGFSVDNDISAAGAAPLDFYTIKHAERLLDEANIPYFPNTGRRILVITPQQWEEVADDAQFARYAEFHKEMNALFPEYLKTVGKFDIFKSNTLRKVTNGSSVPVNRGLAFGPGMFGIGQAGMPEVIPSTDDNYKQTAKVIWVSLLAFKLFDNRFGISVRTG